MQRFFDIVFSGLAILLLSLPLIIIILILRFTGEGEIFYRQSRIGKWGKTFDVLKFATMLKDSPSLGTGTVTLKNDPRVLPFGRFLRKSKINELPQLFNIFLGTMSIVGPRPQTQRCFDAFPEHIQPEIIKVRPGLSGVGSIAFRNEEDIMDSAQSADQIYNNEIMPYKGEMEKWYVHNNNVLVYFKCIFLTAWVVLTGKGGVIYKAFKGLPPAPKNLAPFIYGTAE